jgi:hypothetical protein
LQVPVLSKQPTERSQRRTVRRVSLQEKIEMKKLTMTAVAVLFCLSGAARADSSRRTTTISGSGQQQKFWVGVDGDVALPIGNYSNVNGIGGSLLIVGEYPVMPELSATARIGFQYHANTNTLGVDTHVHSIPVLLGAKYYLMSHGDRQGLFGAFELGLFDLMTDVSGVGSSNDIKFGAGIGVGYAMKEWNARVSLHSQDVGHFGDLMMVTAGVGYTFAGF